MKRGDGTPERGTKWQTRRRRRPCLVAALLAAATLMGGCGFPDHYMVHPHAPAPGVVSTAHDIFQGELLIRLQVAHPPGHGPFPTVLVLPEGGKTAADMQGILWDLAAHGYLAIAADYQRRIGGAYQQNLFAWRSVTDATAIVEIASAQPDVDARCVAAMGFSQGGVYSLLIAAYAPDRIQAVVSYYPVTDFPHWFGRERPNPFRRWAYSIVEWFFRQESGARDDAEFQTMLRRASPYYVAESIRAPVLLIHGDRDTTAPLEESQRMAERLSAAGKTVQLLVIPGGVHIFNFRQPAQAATAWEATLAFLDRYLRQKCLETQAVGGASAAVEPGRTPGLAAGRE
jgi:dipeptidyl aminopeptidase/acylaminoacyl peptidase